jgi:uncharacterized RDD family membrane protein YckC
MLIHIKRNAEVFGPYSIEEAREYLSAGRLSLSDFAQMPGTTEWIPLALVPGVRSAPPPLPATSGQGSTGISHTSQHPGFWLRFVAFVIDMIISNAGGFVMGLLFGIFMGSQGIKDQDVVGGLAGILGIMLQWLYYTCMESSSKQATLGKMACGFIVTDLEGHRISFGKATGRYFGMIVSGLILGIGFFMCAWTERKQCLHDTMAGCLMFKK